MNASSTHERAACGSLSPTGSKSVPFRSTATRSTGFHTVSKALLLNVFLAARVKPRPDTIRAFLRSSAAVVAHAAVPHEYSESGKAGGHQRNQVEVGGKRFSLQEVGGR